MSFEATLTESQRHLKRRLEGFGDVVFGFAMSQLVYQLVVPNTPADLMHPARFLLYFGTFAALTALWFNYHRMLSGAFVPEGVDFILTFVFLAFVTIVPYAMHVYALFISHVSWIRPGIGVYLACAVGTAAPSCVIAWRNLYRGWAHATLAERRHAWLRVLRITPVASVLAFALFVDIAVPFDLAFGIVPPAAIALFLFPIVIPAARRVFGDALSFETASPELSHLRFGSVAGHAAVASALAPVREVATMHDERKTR
jgi:uncharacterized membrane protein